MTPEMIDEVLENLPEDLIREYLNDKFTYAYEIEQTGPGFGDYSKTRRSPSQMLLYRLLEKRNTHIKAIEELNNKLSILDPNWNRFCVFMQHTGPWQRTDI